MKQAFQYSVLKYRPSILLDERINIGLLFHFIEKNEFGNVSKFSFVFPSSLSRISKTFPNIGQGNLPDIRRYLTDFNNLSTRLSEEAYTNDIILRDIIPVSYTHLTLPTILRV